jgi:hypothetical protein
LALTIWTLSPVETWFIGDVLPATPFTTKTSILWEGSQPLVVQFPFETAWHIFEFLIRRVPEM